MNLLKNKNILITGASYGMGAMVAKELSKDNCNLILVSRSKIKLEGIVNECKYKKNHRIIISDFQSKESIINMTNLVKKNYKKLDIIMHIAGGGMGIKHHLPKNDEYLKVFNLNLFAIFDINRELVSLMNKAKGGTLFHVGSIVANEAIGSVSYNVSKAALAAYVRSLSKNLSNKNICVTGINPGAFEYDSNAMARLKKNNYMAYKDFIKNRLPAKKMPKAKDMMELIRILISGNNMIFAGNMISCDSGEGNFYKQFI
jgi:short-subunit dehydrogenase